MATFTRQTAIHVENRRLFGAATGIGLLEDEERDHIHTCEICQGVLAVYLNELTVEKCEPSGPPAQ